MPLTWDISKIKKYKNNIEDAYITKKDETGEWTDVKNELKTFIFWGSAAGFSGITKDNAAEYYARSKVYEKYNKSSFMERWTDDNKLEPVYLTMEMVEETIGLCTNHSTVSTTEWVKRLHKWLDKTEVTTALLKAEVVINKHEYEQWKAQKQKEREGK